MDTESKSLLFRKLFETHGLEIAKMLRGQGYSEDELEEIMQNAYMKAFESFHKLKDVNAFIPWFKRIVINEGKQLIRRNQAGKRKMVISFTSEEELESALEEKAWAAYCVSDDLEIRLWLKEAMKTLPKKYLIPFKLSVVENYTYSEIAKILEISEGTVKSRISRAKKILRKKLEDRTLEEEETAARV